MNVQIHPRFMLLLSLTSFSEVNSAPAAGTGLADAWTVKGILKRLFSFSQRRARGVTVAFHLFPFLVEGGCMESSLVGSYLVVVHSVESFRTI